MSDKNDKVAAEILASEPRSLTTGNVIEATLVERLRELSHAYTEEDADAANSFYEAADEIERLTQRLRDYENHPILGLRDEN